jgi:hypothetical protein
MDKHGPADYTPRRSLGQCRRIPVGREITPALSWESVFGVLLIPRQPTEVTEMKHQLTREDRQRAAASTIYRYGADFIAERMRRGMLREELAKLHHPERLTPEERQAMQKQAMIRQAALMRAAKAARRSLRATATQPVQDEP